VELKTDPLLVILCGERWNRPRALRVYQQIDDGEEMGDVSNCYHSTDFPYLGERLLQLQRYVTAQQPYGWAALWRDRRNASTWWTFWAVLFIGGVTIILSLTQAVFQGIQTIKSS